MILLAHIGPSETVVVLACVIIIANIMVLAKKRNIPYWNIIFVALLILAFHVIKRCVSDVGSE